MVSSHFQRSILVEWPAKTQETEFGVIQSRGNLSALDIGRG